MLAFRNRLCWHEACDLKQLEEQEMISGFAIGVAARRSGCSIASIRYYEDIGLLAPAQRSIGGRRVFRMTDVERLRLIRRLRELDFGLDAVRDLLAAMTSASPSCLDVRELARAHLETVRARRVELEALERTLVGLTASCTQACRAAAPAPDCTIITDLKGAA